MTRGIVLYGPPAAGKDTVTQALCELSSEYVHFPRLKAGPGRTAGYRLTSMEELHSQQERGDILWTNERYGATYAIDRTFLGEQLADHLVVVHVGQVEAITALTTATPGTQWLTVYLWCPRAVAAQRLIARSPSDTAARMRAWDQTRPLSDADLTLNTAAVSARDAARAIHAQIHRQDPGQQSNTAE